MFGSALAALKLDVCPSGLATKDAQSQVKPAANGHVP